MTEDLTEIFAVVAEFKDEAPILMETEGRHTSRAAAFARRDRLLGESRCIRACVVQITADRFGGNDLLLHDMKRIQE